VDTEIEKRVLNSRACYRAAFLFSKEGTTIMAASVRQIEANRRNAAGPHQMTEAGKQSIRTNALRHGLAARLHVVLAGEDEKFYNEILDSLRDEYAPQSTQEEMLVNQIAENYWRLIRARNMESGSFKLGIKIEAEEYGFNRVEPDDLLRGANLATTLSHHHEIFARIARYETTAERSYDRAIRELAKLQTTRQRSRACQQANTPPAEIRSVQQSEPKPAHQRAYTNEEIEMARQTMSKEDFEGLLDKITAPTWDKASPVAIISAK
jgi:hypothetical protein